MATLPERVRYYAQTINRLQASRSDECEARLRIIETTKQHTTLDGLRGGLMGLRLASMNAIRASVYQDFLDKLRAGFFDPIQKYDTVEIQYVGRGAARVENGVVTCVHGDGSLDIQLSNTPYGTRFSVPGVIVHRVAPIEEK